MKLVMVFSLQISYTHTHSIVHLCYSECVFVQFTLICLIRINCALTYIIEYRILNHGDAYLCIGTYSNHNYLGLGKASCLYRRLTCHLTDFYLCSVSYVMMC